MESYCLGCCNKTLVKTAGQIHLKNLLQHKQWNALMPLDRAKTHQIVNITFFTNKSKVSEQKFKMFMCQRTLACNEFIIVLCCVCEKMYILSFQKLWEIDKFLNFQWECYSIFTIFLFWSWDLVNNFNSSISDIWWQHPATSIIHDLTLPEKLIWTFLLAFLLLGAKTCIKLEWFMVSWWLWY